MTIAELIEKLRDDPSCGEPEDLTGNVQDPQSRPVTVMTPDGREWLIDEILDESDGVTRIFVRESRDPNSSSHPAPDEVLGDPRGAEFTKKGS